MSNGYLAPREFRKNGIHQDRDHLTFTLSIVAADEQLKSEWECPWNGIEISGHLEENTGRLEFSLSKSTSPQCTV